MLSSMRWRVISSSPSWEIGSTLVRALSLLQRVLQRLVDGVLVLRCFMSMKSITTSPPMLRRRSWRATSSAASVLTCRMASSCDVPALVPAGVDVDGDQRLGLVEDDVAAGLQPDLAAEGVLELALDVEVLEDRRVAVVELDACRARAARSAPPGRGCARTPRGSR